jgi:hypothetical protein
MKSYIPTLAFASLTALFAAPGAAEAEDVHSYHAAHCRAFDGTEGDWNRSEFRITRTGASGDGSLFCPVQRDEFSCGSGCDVELRVQVLDSHTTGDVMCTFSARAETGSSTSFASDSTAGSGGVDVLTMNVDSPPGDGTYMLKCSMPSNGPAGFAKIFGYATFEEQ